ncbi:4-diphosphocytidyl-2C-methyl-D-erythritol synthase [Streptomyces abyssalis]|uniref:4-diphosphocytidyl-2C-methyl-D-erythritol synthase n=1 Tax=Streptomyces abyssalis TaxID=933944 RepID=A0A1E7JRX6_9ACTN|nr:nucleotidyltransferase family protein [Streptomyces abyssalis]OEU91631.1 4-diphosphocytidyl-2C-methyl-D-erythritol synthase [Streptomyces abyssalis]OEU94232.1 4-diphosphocytidyl-2C-methyl-D-erythritol synthase [Streptomyces abyssalis]
MTTKRDEPEGPAAPVVAGLLLAAGGGRRLGGRPKALLPLHGRPLVEHAVRTLRAGGCERVHVVLGAAAGQVRARAELSGCTVLDNPYWESGMGSSLRLGLDSLTGTGTDAALVLLVDQPGIGAGAVARVRSVCRSSATLAAASYEGRRGHPVLFGAEHWAGIVKSAEGDQGARPYLRTREDEIELVECGDIADPSDIDTPQDLERLKRTGS